METSPWETRLSDSRTAQRSFTTASQLELELEGDMSHRNQPSLEYKRNLNTFEKSRAGASGR